MKKKLLIIAGLSATMIFSSCSEATKDVEEAAHDTTEHVEDMAKEVEEEVSNEKEVVTIKLEETEGAFTTEELNLEAGQPYLFEVSNSGVDKEIAFVLAPASLKDATVEEIMAGGVADAGLTKMVNNGETAISKAPVTLEAGEYFYFCPLNATPHYKVIVAEAAKTIKLEETEGAFTTKELNLTAGQPYLFEVSNNGVDKEIAFVLAPASLKDATVEEIMAGGVADAGLTKMVNNGETAISKAPVTLEAGEYFYFCPLNATPHYKVTVQ